MCRNAGRSLPGAAAAGYSNRVWRCCTNHETPYYRSDIVVPIDQKFSWSSSNINEKAKSQKPLVSVTDASEYDDIRVHLDIVTAAKCNTASSSSSTMNSRSGSITDPGSNSAAVVVLTSRQWLMSFKARECLDQECDILEGCVNEYSVFNSWIQSQICDMVRFRRYG